MANNKNEELIKRLKVKLIMADQSIASFCRERDISYHTYKDFKKGKTTGQRGKNVKRLLEAIQDFLKDQDTLKEG